MNIDLKQSSETELLSYQIALQSIQIALNEQIRKVKDAGINITHFNGERHIQVFPSVRNVVVKLAKKYILLYFIIIMQNRSRGYLMPLLMSILVKFQAQWMN